MKNPVRTYSLLYGSRKAAGFTLIEMAIVLIVAGIVISIIASVLPSLIQSGKIRQANAGLERVDYTLQGYITATGRVPCPDTDGNGEENRITGEPSPGADTCTNYVGDLPYKTLGLSSGNDIWGNPIKYAVYADLITTTTGTGSNPFCTEIKEVINYYDPADKNNLPDTSKLYVTDANGQNPKNMAYILVSGGSKDLDGDRRDGLYDGYNEGRDLSFDAADRSVFYGDPVNQRYDDLVRTVSFAYLSGKIGCGTETTTSPGGTTPGSSEYQDPGDCSDGVDNDGDGHTDCMDQDCYGKDTCPAGGSVVGITTTSIPDGNVGCSYSTTLKAIGGITPYEWDLTNNGGFSSLFLNTYTGQLNSGALDQCPGTYTIGAQVEDATPVADGGPTTDSGTFTLQVNTDLSVARTSGSGTNITWDNPFQVETFQAAGCFLGNITWSLDTGGAPGFSATSTGSDTCSIQHSGTSPGTYNFRLTAIDDACPASNTAELVFVVTVTATGGTVPIPPSVVSEWQFDECSWNGTPDEVTDSQGPNNGTAQNGANTVGTGKICRGGYFDGTNDYVNMGDALNAVLGTTSNQFSVVAWINPQSLGSSRTNHQTANCFIAKASDPNNDNLEIGVNPNGSIHVYIDTSGQDRYADFGPANAVQIGRWSFVALRYDNGTVTVNINGTNYTNSTRWSGGGNLDNASGSLFTIGSSQHINNYFNGRIDEVSVYATPLTDTEISNLQTVTRPSCSGSCIVGPIAAYYMDEPSWTIGSPTVIDSIGGRNGTPRETAPGGRIAQSQWKVWQRRRIRQNRCHPRLDRHFRFTGLIHIRRPNDGHLLDALERG